MAVQFWAPFSQLSMWVATSDFLTASGPTSAASLAIIPANWASIPAGLSLSHSRPRPLFGAGAFSTPVEVCPKRRIDHLPPGTSQAMRPPALIFALRSAILSPAMVILAGSAFSAAGGASRRS